MKKNDLTKFDHLSKAELMSQFDEMCAEARPRGERISETAKQIQKRRENNTVSIEEVDDLICELDVHLAKMIVLAPINKELLRRERIGLTQLEWTYDRGMLANSLNNIRTEQRNAARLRRTAVSVLDELREKANGGACDADQDGGQDGDHGAGQDGGHAAAAC